jgi:tetratricopeptide (TPR) repeat protein
MKKRLHIFPAAVAILFFAWNVFAAAAQTEFDAANQLYDEGKFSGAANAYEKILQSGSVSPALLFNYGNAEFKSGQIGRAIAALRKAEQLAPRDSDVRANLEFVRNQVQGPSLRESRWEDWLGALNLNEWTTLAASALWITFALMAAMQIRPALKPVLRGLARVALVVTILLCATVGVEAAIHFSKPIAVVVAPDVVLRSGPFDEAQSAFTVHAGAELAVTDQRNDWLQVTDGAGRIGWLPRKQAEFLTAN